MNCSKIIRTYGLKIFVTNTKSVAFKGYFHVRCKLMLNDQLVEQVRSFRFPGCYLSYVGEIDVDKKVEKFNHVCGTIRKTLNGKVRRDTIYFEIV